MNGGASTVLGTEPRVCSVEGCGKKHRARGYCTNHYQSIAMVETRRAWQRKKYAEDPAFRAMKLERSKAHSIEHDRTAQIAAWRAANPEKATAYFAAVRKRHLEKNGCARDAKYRPGMEVVVVVNDRPYHSLLASPAYRFEGKWAVDVLLPWGERVRFWTKEVAL